MISVQQNLTVVERTNEIPNRDPDWCILPEVTNYRVTWTLNNYENVPCHIGVPCKSCPFNLGGYAAWISLYPVGWRKDASGMVDFDIHMCDNDCPVSIYLEIMRDPSFISGKLVFRISNIKSIEMLLGKDTFTPGLGWGVPRACSRKRFSTGTKVVECVLSLLYSTTKPLLPEDCDSDLLIRNLGSALENEDFSDITIQIGTHELKAHKNILAARSSVFAAMLKSGMVETRTNVINITDVDVQVMRQILKYIYTGKVENLKDCAHELIVVADKYDLQTLKTRCERELCNQVDMDSVANLALLAYFHKQPTLLKATFDFIKRNWREFLFSEGWREIKKASSDFAFVTQSLIDD